MEQPLSPLHGKKKRYIGKVFMVQFSYAGQNFILQGIATLCLIVGGGLLISILNKLFFKVVKSPRLQHITGIIGTPIHELSHAFFCIVFRHKITEMKLFQIDEETGVLGYVRHEYNKRSIYQRLGCFFIGVAPILIGSLVITLLLRFFCVSLFMQFSVITDILAINSSNVGVLIAGLAQMMQLFFVFALNPMWWLYIVIAGMMAQHMTLSLSDIKSGIIGGIVFFILIFLTNLILAFVNIDSAVSFGKLYFRGILYLSFIITMAIIISAFILLMAILIKGIGIGIKKLPIKKI